MQEKLVLKDVPGVLAMGLMWRVEEEGAWAFWENLDDTAMYWARYFLKALSPAQRELDYDSFNTLVAESVEMAIERDLAEEDDERFSSLWNEATRRQFLGLVFTFIHEFRVAVFQDASAE
jgi:hypothetical protein